MNTPSITRIELDGAAAGFFGASIVRGFLQSEGVHRQDEAKPRHAIVPVRQNPRDTVTQQRTLAKVEIPYMRSLQREQIARPVEEDSAVQRDGALEVPIQPRACRCDVSTFTRVGAR